jgi:hypothetical protein
VFGTLEQIDVVVTGVRPDDVIRQTLQRHKIELVIAATQARPSERCADS